MKVKALNHYTINKVTTDLKVNPFSILKLISKLYDDWVTLHAQSENFTTLLLSTCKDWNKCIYFLCKYSMFGNVKDFLWNKQQISEFPPGVNLCQKYAGNKIPSSSWILCFYSVHKGVMMHLFNLHHHEVCNKVGSWDS